MEIEKKIREKSKACGALEYSYLGRIVSKSKSLPAICFTAEIQSSRFPRYVEPWI
jgi:hypothetical protein